MIFIVAQTYPFSRTTCSFDGAGYSLSGTKQVLTSLASNALVEQGDCINAVELFWTPAESNEILSRSDLIIDFPELIDL
jgi:uncharacterized membrane protein